MNINITHEQFKEILQNETLSPFARYVIEMVADAAFNKPYKEIKDFVDNLMNEK